MFFRKLCLDEAQKYGKGLNEIYYKYMFNKLKYFHNQNTQFLQHLLKYQTTVVYVRKPGH